MKQKQSNTDPHSEELERKLLALLVNHPENFLIVENLLSPEMFYNVSNGIVYKTLSDLSKEGIDINLPSITERIENSDALEVLQGLDREIVGYDYKDWAYTIIEKFMLRSLIKLSNEIKNKATGNGDPFQILSETAEQIYKIENNQVEPDKDLWGGYKEIIEEIEKKYTGEIKEGLQSQSFPSLNNASGGFMSTDFVVIYGLEKQGKSTFVDRLLLDFIAQGKKVGIFSLEMDFSSIAHKAISMETGIDYLKLRNPKGAKLTQEEFTDFNAKAVKKFKDKLFLIDDRTSDFNKIVSKIKLWRRRYGVDLFVIDYLGLIETNEQFEARRLYIKHYSRRLKNLCKEIGAPILAVSQANEENKTAESKDPLRDADFAISAYKPFENGGLTITHGSQSYTFKEDDFLITVERSRHGRNKQNFVCGFVNNNFIERDVFVKDDLPF